MYGVKTQCLAAGMSSRLRLSRPPAGAVMRVRRETLALIKGVSGWRLRYLKTTPWAWPASPKQVSQKKI